MEAQSDKADLLRPNQTKSQNVLNSCCISEKQPVATEAENCQQLWQQKSEPSGDAGK